MCSLPLTKEIKMNAKIQAIVMSYLRTALSAILGAYIAGQTDPKLLGSLALSAVAGPLLRALNPKDAAFGRTAK
jgi:hypothetical protein